MRVRNWDVALVEAIGHLRDTDVVWGETDCVSLCIRALEAMYEPDHLPLPPKSDRPTWTTRLGAARVLNREPAFCDVLRDHGCQEVGLTVVQSGDILCGLPPVDGMEGYGVSVEQGFLHVEAEERVVWTPMRGLWGDAPGDIIALRPPHG